MATNARLSPFLWEYLEQSSTLLSCTRSSHRGERKEQRMYGHLSIPCSQQWEYHFHLLGMDSVYWQSSTGLLAKWFFFCLFFWCTVLCVDFTVGSLYTSKVNAPFLMITTVDYVMPVLSLFKGRNLIGLSDNWS